MSDNHDYNGVLSVIDCAIFIRKTIATNRIILSTSELHTIRHALLIADRVMGEPSADMRHEFYESYAAVYVPEKGEILETQPVSPFISGYKAMRDQLLLEIEGGE